MRHDACSRSTPSLLEIACREMTRRGLLADFSPEEMRELEALTAPERTPATNGVVRDLRTLLWCSIDNAESRDLDQLTVAESLPGGETRVLVGIADVDARVDQGTLLDAHARHNTTTVYTPPRIFSMLPERLSTDLTSLNADEDRLALVAELVVSEGGEVVSSEIYRALVRNQARLCYEDVGAWLEGATGVPETVAACPGQEELLRIQDAVAQALKATRHRKGALELDTFRAEAVVEDGKVVELKVDRKNRARELVEEIMIAANGAFARYLRSQGLPSLRRVVRAPRRWDRIVALAAEFGEQLPTQPDSAALEQFLRRRKQADPKGHVDLSLRVVKMMGGGEYAVDDPHGTPVGHFALAVRDYAHSTAPNRRYPDIITHRLVKAALAGEPSPYDLAELEALARHCTDRENDANRVERQVRKSAAALLMAPRVGEEFDAIVTGVTQQHDVFCRTVAPPVDGKLVRNRTGVDVGDLIRVRLLEVDVEAGVHRLRAASLSGPVAGDSPHWTKQPA